MTHVFDNINGASLEDCHTNFFALADLNGIKWRRLYVDSLFIDPLEDPVLKSYSKCLSAGILTVWRRVLVQRAGIHQTQENNNLSYFKELWVFWHGEGPDFSNLVESSLTEAEQGSWESGLSYECRTLLFKALHNLIERCLLSRGYTRLGRLFVEPQVLPITKKNRKQIASAVHFFIHGESTVCASIDDRQVSAVYMLDKCHISAAQTGQKNVKVILAPYGMEGKLTGVGYKYNDPHMARFLNNWHMFYLHPHGRANWKINSEMSSIVEVLIGGARMKYPASYVFVTEEDHLEAFPSSDNSTSNDCVLPTAQPNLKPSNVPAPGLLTPPMSPAETSALGDFSRYQNSVNNVSPKSQIDSISAANEIDYSNLILHSVSQECYASVVREKSDENSTLWDFQDYAVLTSCNCSICTRKHNTSKNSQGYLGKDGNASNMGPYSLVNSTNVRNHKSGRMYAPFHLRQSVTCHTSSDTQSSFKKESGKSLTMDFRTFSSNSSLPQLQSSFTQPKKQPLPNSTSGDTYFSHLSSSDPVMPTLSPQPPVIKEEPEEVQTQINISSLCRDSSQGVPLKGKISDELLSPLHTSLLNSFENAKLFNKKSPIPLSIEANQSEDDPQTEVIASDNNIECQILEKPRLQKRTHEESAEAELTMNGLLYNYQYLNSPLWYPLPAKSRCLPSSNSIAVNKNDLNDSNCDTIENTYEMDDVVPCVPKDPYEFTEFEESTPSERGFRPKTELYLKDDKMLPNVSPMNSASTAMPSVVPVQVQEMVSHLNDESDKALSPTTKNFCPKFIREEDLAVSLHDLDNIFDTSSSEGEDADMPVTPSKLMAYDEFSGKIELSRMYPTPPSLEQHAVPSPFGPLTGTDITTSETDAYREDFDVDHSNIVNYEHENIDVWYPPLITEFIESSKYAALLTLPSFIDSKSDQELVYRPLWTHSNSKLKLNSSNEDNQLSEVQQVYSQQNAIYDEEQASSNLYSQESMIDSSFPMSNCEAVSPASSVPSYLNKNLNSIDAVMSHSAFEIHPLLVNLLLSDSLLNLFKDHNFDCCCVCACNMNIKGSDAGIILPSSLIPTWNDEPQYKCTCGFSAVVYRHRSYNSGLFYEDELEVTGSVCDNGSSTIYSTVNTKMETEQSESQKISLPMETIPSFVLDILRIQCKTLISPFSLFHKFRLSAKTENHSFCNGIELSDGREICFMALEEARMSMENVTSSNKFEESLKSSCLHKWPYVSSPLPSSSQDIRLHLESIKPLLQHAVHKKNTQRLWEVTYVVSGPLTWREFHRLAARGADDQCEPQPIPSLLLGHDKDSVAVSPFSVKHWDKLHLEPHSLPRDIAYIVVAPENDVVLSSVKSFFRELSCTYEAHNLGKHRPITKVLRDGIMRVGKTAASKVAEEPVSEWFNSIGDGPIANKLKLYARVCKHRLAPHLSTLSLDKSIFNSSSKTSESASSSSSSSSHFPENAEKSSVPKHTETEFSMDTHSASIHDSSEDSDQDVPALVIYIVEPFTFAQSDPDVYRLVVLSIMHAYSDMVSNLPEAVKNAIHLQILSLDSIMCNGSDKIKGRKNRGMKQRKNMLKSLALSVYSQSYLFVTPQHTVKSLTGFGPAAAQDQFISNRNSKVFFPTHVFNQAYVIASVKDKQTELGEMFGDRREKCGVLYCCYCLTKDKKYILACCTNDKGEFTETTVINIGIPNRDRRKQCSVRKFGLRKLLEFILEVISVYVHPWRLIIDRFGTLGHGELKAWASLLNRKSLQSYSKHLKDICNQCSISGINDGPSILSACLVSLGPDSALRIMHDQFTPDDRFSSSRYKTCCLNTPEDATCTHILVFPTSAITQSSQATFHQEHIDPLPNDLFELDDDDLPGPDMNDIFHWTESPQSAGNSPRHDGCSQPSSPGSSFRLSNNHGEQNKCENILTESPDEALQLLQQPLALGYYVSTAKVGPVPKWFWASCPQMENKLPVFLKSALLIHLPFIQQSSDEWLPNNNQQQLLCHPLDSNFTTDVLRYVLEGYNALSWLQLDSKYCDRRSCLPIHMQILMQLYGIVETIL
ncbi:mediator of RNA polymerase II transcription subunit 13 [Trichonephila clavata]|uniref:Mediator of RNA polymerase II transcription subunit 13 n=1 Tax=Trichonephila clavata TaxID=2740835 RepID=A0A8X6LWE4_TRICU|nr:mediator of RNA polymerase II transcription subunit 13 [Trichonephila clavata]